MLILCYPASKIQEARIETFKVPQNGNLIYVQTLHENTMIYNIMLELYFHRSRQSWTLQQIHSTKDVSLQEKCFLNDNLTIQSVPVCSQEVQRPRASAAMCYPTRKRSLQWILTSVFYLYQCISSLLNQ